MASRIALCGICNLRQITKQSDVWCPECEEGFCLECKEHHGLSKATRNHNTVPISQYEKLPTNVLEISQFCSEHKEKFQIYCKKHDHLCCSICVVSDHQECHDLIQLNDMIRNVKKSYGFHDMEQAMINMIENMQRIKKDRQNNLLTLKAEKKMIEKEIDQTRIKINHQLDKFQNKLMKELYESEFKESKAIGELLDSIEKNEKEIREYQENLVNIKQHASDLQTFLAMKQMERDLAEKDEYFSSFVNKEILKLGDIVVSTHPSEVAIIRKKETQAQIVAAHVRSMSIENLSFVLQSTVNTKLKDVEGCALLPDGRMVFSCSKKKLVRVFNIYGSQYFDISLKLKHAFDITYIHATNTIAVTSGEGIISIIDVETKKVKETISVGSGTYGIVSRNNTLIYCVANNGIQMINLTDKAVSNIVKRYIPGYVYIATFGDELYYTNQNTHTVTCCDLNGTTLWEFKDERILGYPLGISADNAGNVYVVGFWSHNVVVISPGGQRHRELLSKKSGLYNPSALHFDRSNNMLLAANQTGDTFLYKLE